jgi:serine/threonine-protein kinase
MKPANVMIKPDGDIKLIDFGIARTYKAENAADTTILGTAGYAPREQYGWGQTDARSDIYSLGATMFHAVTGYGPGAGDQFLNVPIRHFNPALSGGLENVILKCTQANPNDRYQSCDELMYALEHYQEADDAFLARQRFRLRRFVVMVLCVLIFAGVGFAGLLMNAQTNNQAYGQFLVLAENAPNPLEKIKYYTQMIDIKPTERAPWFGIIDTSKSDTRFDLDEEKILIDTLTKYLTELRQQSYYPEIAFEVGKLYWYYYSYGQTDDTAGDNIGIEDASNRTTQMKSATRWFLDAMEYGGEDGSNFEISQIYSNIGAFAETINTSVAEASDAGKYKLFFEDLSDLERMLSSGTEHPEIVSLTVDLVVLDSIETYARKFESDGISEVDIRTLIENARTNAQSVDATTDKTQAMKNRILNDGADAARNAVDRAYKADERGLEY